MPSIQIEILSQKKVTKPTKTPGKTYESLEVAYKNLSFQGKVEGKNIMSFGASKAAFDTLSVSQSGEVYEIEYEKNGAGYNDWLTAKKGVAGASGATAQSSPGQYSVGSVSSTTNASPRSTYETPEERAKKQVFIVRQSSLSSAIDLLSVGAKSAPSVDQILEVAKKFESFVFDDGSASLSKGLSIEDIQDSQID